MIFTARQLSTFKCKMFTRYPFQPSQGYLVYYIAHVTQCGERQVVCKIKTEVYIIRFFTVFLIFLLGRGRM